MKTLIRGRQAFAALGAVLLAVLFLAVPASAAGKPYSQNAWAGVRAYQVKGPNGIYDTWRRPTAVQASWYIPCLPETFDGVTGSVQGAYDQWIGLESEDGVSLIQVGVRSYHLDLGFGNYTGHFAWIMSTATGNAYPTEVFPIYGCGRGFYRVTARVNAGGAVCILLESSGDCRSGMLVTHKLPPLTNPRWASFIIERFPGGTGNMPYFNLATFDDCKVLHSNSNSGWYIGNRSYADAWTYDMTNSWWTNRVHTYAPSPSGSFSAVQPPVSYYPW